jgi:hypothetical protein
MRTIVTRRLALFWLRLVVCGALAPGTLQALQTNVPPSPPMPGYQVVGAGIKLRHLSPVEYFRGLLGMSPAERERALAGKTTAQRALLLAKLREYDALPRPIREARLCQTELHWELSGLMKLAPDERAGRLAEVSPPYRPMIDSLLKKWDGLPAETQSALLTNRNFLSVFLHTQTGPTAALPAVNRQQMDQALQADNHLAPAQRQQCLVSLQKISAMSVAEQSQFLKNAARWNAMGSHERQLWREMVHTLPPMPPGASLKLPPMPMGWQDAQPIAPPMPPNVTTPVIVARATKTPEAH